MPSAIDERRKHVRHPLILRVSFADADLAATDWTENVSAGGIFVQTKRQMNLGERARVELSFPGFLEPVTIAGLVAWSRPGSAWEEPGFGLQADTGVEHLTGLVSSWRGTDESPLDPSIHVLVVQSQIEPGAAAGRVLLERAADRQEAICRARAKPPSLILTDLFFPESDCLRMIKDLTQEPARPILVANSNNPDDTARAQMLGACVLPRTVRFAHLFQTVLTLRNARGLGGVVAA
jgi:uncharacterized protein (TIGR02266 family)